MPAREVATIYLPDGYADAAEFARDCGVEVAAHNDPCLTPGAKYEININKKGVFIGVNFPHYMKISADTAQQLENSLHKAVEAVLASLWSPDR